MTSLSNVLERPQAETLVPETADAERQRRAVQQAQNCVLLAVVTSPTVAAELIDRAIAYRSSV